MFLLRTSKTPERRLSSQANVLFRTYSFLKRSVPGSEEAISNKRSPLTIKGRAGDHTKPTSDAPKLVQLTLSEEVVLRRDLDKDI